MKHIGQALKNQIEISNLRKKDVAESAGISYNYLSTLFKQESMDCLLFEKLCIASGLSPLDIFETEIKDTDGSIVRGASNNANISVGEVLALRELLAEKERLIRVLMAQLGLQDGTNSEQKVY